MNTEFKTWVLSNARNVIHADYRGLTMLHMIKKLIYNPVTFEPEYKYRVIDRKLYNEIRNAPDKEFINGYKYWAYDFIKWVINNRIEVTKYDGIVTQTLLKSTVRRIYGLDEPFNVFELEYIH